MKIDVSLGVSTSLSAENERGYASRRTRLPDEEGPMTAQSLTHEFSMSNWKSMETRSLQGDI